EYTMTVFCTVTDPPTGTMGMVAVPFRFFSALLEVLTSTYFIVEALAWAVPWFVTTTVMDRLAPANTVVGRPGTVTDVTARSGVGVTWMFPVEVRQLFCSSCSDDVLPLSAQAWSLYC